MGSPTEEQYYAIELAKKFEPFKVSAYAGTGKTTTLKQISYTLPNKKGLYLAFNRAIADEAQKKFKSNVRCMTFHSLALTGVPSYIKDKLNLSRTQPLDIARLFQLRPISLKVDKNPQKEQLCTSWELGAIVERTINAFCSSCDTEINIGHVLKACPTWADLESFSHYAHQLVAPSQSFWEMSISRDYNYKIGHNIYLKKWSLDKPQLETDFILFDEAQDADPIMLNLLKNQSAMTIWVGDKHQQIYDWRGAENAMQSLNIPEAKLTKSFRFGQAVADSANLILKNLLKEDVPLIGNEKIKSTIGSVDEPDAYLVRTNAGAFNLALLLANEGRRPKVEVDAESLSKQIKDAEKLSLGIELDKTSDYYGFDTWEEAVMYANDYPSADITPFTKLIVKNGIPRLKAALANMSQTEGDCIVSTAHKSKGLEFGSVLLFNDFNWNENLDKNKVLMDEGEARLTYVAATRAQNNLDYFGLSRFFEELKKMENDKNIYRAK